MRKARIHTSGEHGISRRMIDADAVWVVRQLRRAGFHGYIVGGAVRDLLLGREPKDFDVATDARPQSIRRIFRSARIIGRRFRIVHVYCAPGKYIEVTTFRSRSFEASPQAPLKEDNLFGTIEEDAERRDFTMNALYYCPIEEQLIDYVGGFEDVKARRLRTLAPAESSFLEDPVRMIRAVKYSTLVDFPIPFGMAGLIKRHRASVLKCSRERVTEEVFKILVSGESERILEASHRLRLFEVMFPAIHEYIEESGKRFPDTSFAQRLRALDSRTREGSLLPRESMFGFLFQDVALESDDIFKDQDPEFLMEQYLRAISPPLFPSRRDLTASSRELLREGRKRKGLPQYSAR